MVTNDQDALLTVLYLEIDDHVVPASPTPRPTTRLSDAELLILASAQVLLGIDSNDH
jgi:4-hydroxybenzoate polyprenyltransferase